MATAPDLRGSAEAIVPVEEDPGLRRGLTKRLAALRRVGAGACPLCHGRFDFLYEAGDNKRAPICYGCAQRGKKGPRLCHEEGCTTPIPAGDKARYCEEHSRAHKRASQAASYRRKRAGQDGAPA